MRLWQRSPLSLQNWLTIAGIAVTVFIGYFSVTDQIAQRRERRQKAYGSRPTVQATINRDAYEGGWRSVQLHIAKQPNGENIEVNDWRIVRAALLKPAWPVVLARAENDDYASRVFYANDPVRALIGKPDGRPQRFALEFFIHFKRDDDRARCAKFQVVFARRDGGKNYTVKVWTAVPEDAQLLA